MTQPCSRGRVELAQRLLVRDLVTLRSYAVIGEKRFHNLLGFAHPEDRRSICPKLADKTVSRAEIAEAAKKKGADTLLSLCARDDPC